MEFTLSLPIINWVEFLDPELLLSVQQMTLANRDSFVPTTVSTGEQDYRKSSVLWHHQFPEINQRFLARLEQIIPSVKKEMGDFAMQHGHTKIEVQCCCHHRNNDHFKKHIDNASIDTYGRRISYVYYYYLSETKNFTGGQLNIYLQNGTRVIEPIHNSVVFFPSHLYHEVMPIHSDTEAFEDGRHSLVGWIWS